jgi:hypothetical protein
MAQWAAGRGSADPLVATKIWAPLVSFLVPWWGSQGGHLQINLAILQKRGRSPGATHPRAMYQSPAPCLFTTDLLRTNQKPRPNCNHLQSRLPLNQKLHTHHCIIQSPTRHLQLSSLPSTTSTTSITSIASNQLIACRERDIFVIFSPFFFLVKNTDSVLNLRGGTFSSLLAFEIISCESLFILYVYFGFACILRKL